MPVIVNSYARGESRASLEMETGEYKPSSTKKSPSKILLAIFENIILFLIFAFLQWGELFFDISLPDINLDYCIIYIILVGILWGQVQAYIAMFLSTALFVGVSIYTGVDIITFIYTPGNLVQIAIYMLVGIITGYTIERKNREIEYRELSYQGLSSKYNFLLNIYRETKLVKKELEAQIIDTEDSFSAIYGIIQEVDSLEIERVFSGAITAIERIMKTDQASIYTVSKRNIGNDIDSPESNSNNEYFDGITYGAGDSTRTYSNFLRLKARSLALEDKVPNSIKVSDFPQIEEVIATRCVYANKKFEAGIPVMIAPVLEEKKVVAIISIHKVEFENLTIHYENLFTTVVGLIASAIKRAYFFEKSLKDKRYIPDTRILVPDIFEKVLSEVKNNKMELGMSYSLLRILTGNKPYSQLSGIVSGGIRDNDYIGLSHDENMYVLLSNTRNNYAGLVIERLKNRGVESELVQGEQIDE